MTLGFNLNFRYSPELNGSQASSFINDLFPDTVEVEVLNTSDGAMPNKSDHQRAALLIEFLPKYIKPVEDLVSYLDDKFKNNCSKRVSQLLGFNYPYPKIMDTSKSVNQIGIGYKANK